MTLALMPGMMPFALRRSTKGVPSSAVSKSVSSNMITPLMHSSRPAKTTVSALASSLGDDVWSTQSGAAENSEHPNNTTSSTLVAPATRISSPRPTPPFHHSPLSTQTTQKGCPPVHVCRRLFLLFPPLLLPLGLLIFVFPFPSPDKKEGFRNM